MIFKCVSLRRQKTAFRGKHLVTLHRMMFIVRWRALYRSALLLVNSDSVETIVVFDHVNANLSGQFQLQSVVYSSFSLDPL